MNPIIVIALACMMLVTHRFAYLAGHKRGILIAAKGFRAPRPKPPEWIKPNEDFLPPIDRQWEDQQTAKN